VDALGSLVRFRILPARAHDLAGVPGLPGGLPFGAFVGDRAFDADWLLEDPEKRGAEAVIPSKRNRTAPRDHDREMYGWRHLVENFFARTREFRAIATRYDKTAESFAAGLAPSPAWWPRHDCQRALALAPPLFVPESARHASLR